MSKQNKYRLFLLAFFLLVGIFAISRYVLPFAFDAETTYQRSDQKESAKDIPSQKDEFHPGTASPAFSPENLDPEIYAVPGTPYSRGLHLMFFADGYLSWKDFNTDIDILLEQMQKVEPWASYARYNVYKIKPAEVTICGVQVKDERKPVLRCDPEKINGYLNKIIVQGHFKLIVLSRRDFQSWANVSRIADSGIFFSIPQSPADEIGKKTLGMLFLHMLGHAFGLKDEEIFVIAKAHSAAHQPDGPNCAPDKATAEKWWGDLIGIDPRVGYFQGCAAHTEYIKPTEGSLMNLGDLSKFIPDYGPVSEEYLRKMLTYCFSEKIYSVSDDPSFFQRYPELKECAR